jgi:2-oxoglutarate dehydrogenase E1 component
MMKQMLSNSYLFGTNAPFIEELYDAYLANPASVSGLARLFRQAAASARRRLHRAGRGALPGHRLLRRDGQARPGADGRATAQSKASRSSVLQLINAYRFLGNRWASSIR